MLKKNTFPANFLNNFNKSSTSYRYRIGTGLGFIKTCYTRHTGTT